ncbi:MAG: hypothetical protein ACR2NS_06220 [Gemmatimonadaceae bacterium]
MTAGYACSKGSSDANDQQTNADQPKKKGKKHKQKDQQQQQQEQQTQAPNVAAASPDIGNASCDASLWKRVYNPSRLQVLSQCKVVTGTIEEVGPDDDGDVHMLLKLDAGQDNLINKKNTKKKNGDLVIEVVCANTPTLAAAVQSCKGYKNSIAVPKNGARVKVSGSYVIDTHNGWAELHPVSEIDATR